MANEVNEVNEVEPMRAVSSTAAPDRGSRPGRPGTIDVAPELARRIHGPGLAIDQFLHQVKERRQNLQAARGIGMQRNKDVFLKELTVVMGELANTFTYYRDDLKRGHEAAEYWLVQLAAEASLFAEWDARAGVQGPGR